MSSGGSNSGDGGELGADSKVTPARDKLNVE